MKSNLITLRVWGDFACFTRPEMKVERVSYPVITPSAARGILEAVFWEPQMFYLIDSIHVVKRGRWVSFRRNEVTKVISLDNATTWMKDPAKTTPVQAGGGADDGTQRNMLALEGVEYLITAQIGTTSLADPSEDRPEKYFAEFKRRARGGKCFHRPSLGVREFAADFDWEDDAETAHERRTAELGRSTSLFDEDFGLILYDVFDHRERLHAFRWLRAEEIAEWEREFESSLTRLKKSDQTKRRREFALRPPRSTRQPIEPKPTFFHAKIEASRMDCHPDRVRILIPQSRGD